MKNVNRRIFLQAGLGTILASPLWAAVNQENLEAAADVLAKAAGDGQVHGAALCVRQGGSEFVRTFGAAKSADAIFLIASISKPMSVAALMTLYDRGQFRLEDPVRKFIPEFAGDGREKITIRQLLTHVSGLPDQLPENKALRARHAALEEFVEGAIRTPLLFQPGARYEYSSMGILLASEIAQRITGKNFLEFLEEAVFQPLQMKRSALGLGRFKMDDLMRCQTENAAPESGAGDSAAKDWDWNSPYWRQLGAPWGGVHASAPDVARFFSEILHPTGKTLKPQTALLMIKNHNRADQTSRGLGFAVGSNSGSRGCSEKTFGHTGSTGTLAWADPASDTVCVVLTTLPGRAMNPHPRHVVGDLVASGN